jgi:hypothetical protein
MTHTIELRKNRIALAVLLSLALLGATGAFASVTKGRGPWLLTALPAIGTVTWRCEPVAQGERPALGFKAFAASATDRIELRAGGRTLLDRVVQPGQGLRLPYLAASRQQFVVTQSTEPGTLRAYVTVDFGPRPISRSHCWSYLPPGVTVRLLPR